MQLPENVLVMAFRTVPDRRPSASRRRWSGWLPEAEEDWLALRASGSASMPRQKMWARELRARTGTNLLLEVEVRQIVSSVVV